MQDLNEQFQRAQAVQTNEGMPKWLIALIVGMILSLGLIIVMGTVFIVKMLDKVVAAPSDSDSSYSQEYSEDSGVDIFGTGNADSDSTGGTTNRFQSSSKDVTANFKFGTVSGTSYYSSFSGVSFKAPSDWSVSSYAESKYVNLLSPKDMSASSKDMSETVIISYEAMKSHFYEDIREALSTQIRMATTGTNTMINDNVSASYGGNQFTGILYKKSSEFYTGYIQVMVAEVNGYVLEIYVESDTQEELNTVLEMLS